MRATSTADKCLRGILKIPCQDRDIVRYALERRIITAKSIRGDIHLRHVCERTIRNRLREAAGLRSHFRSRVTT